MEGIKKTIESRLKQKPNKNIHSEIHALADEVSSSFGERAKFAMYLGAIKRIGATRARAIFAEIRESGAREPNKLFFWKCGEIKTAPKPRKSRKKTRPARRQSSLFEKI